MSDSEVRFKGYALATVVGAIAGGVGVAIATRAIPRVMSAIMSGMTRKHDGSDGGGRLRPGGDVTADDSGLR